jgi:hypothetical protein
LNSNNTIWTKTGDAGILIPTGSTASGSTSATITYLQVKEKALELAQMYEKYDVPLPPTCDLAKHIADAVRISDLWMMAREGEIVAGARYHGAQLDRIANAFASVKNADSRTTYMRALTRNSLDMFDRAPSHAKDILWEMELCALLKAKSFVAELKEPDIVVTMGNHCIGIACKKVYSEGNVETTLSNGVAQIERRYELGILAINLDDLLPPNQIRVASSDKALSKSLSADNFAFLGRHGRHFKKYLGSNRILGVIAATGGFAVLNDVVHTTRQFTIWVFPNLDEARTRLLHELQTGLMPS